MNVMQDPGKRTEIILGELLHFRHDENARTLAYSLLDGQRKEDIEQFREKFGVSPMEYLTSIFPPEPKTRALDIS